MRRSRAIRAARAVLGALAVTLVACGGDDDDTPSGTTTPPSPGALPPGLLECFADEGFDIESQDDIHTAPPQVVETCFNELHRGGGS
ncbi:MAG TPA: hypothetical protein VF082_02760 [Jiangellaceae bacterium]